MAPDERREVRDSSQKKMEKDERVEYAKDNGLPGCATKRCRVETLWRRCLDREEPGHTLQSVRYPPPCPSLRLFRQLPHPESSSKFNLMPSPSERKGLLVYQLRIVDDLHGKPVDPLTLS